jgi:hypothetical protein
MKGKSVLVDKLRTLTDLVVTDQSRVGFVQERRNGLLDLIHGSTRIPDIRE